MAKQTGYKGAVGPGARYAGIDQGVDFTGAFPVYALANAVVTRVLHGGSGWPGQGAVVNYRITGGPAKGSYVYVAEDFNPAVRVGQVVKQGQIIGQATGSGRAPGIEMGWAQPSGIPLAPRPASRPADQYTPEGASFAKFAAGTGYVPVSTGSSPYQGSTPAGDLQNAAQTVAFLDQLPPVPKGSTANPLIHFESKPLQAPTDALALAKAYLASTGGAFSNPGFARYAHGLAGTALPASTLGQSASGSHTSSPREGDLAFFGSPASHQGIHVDATHVLHGTDGGTVLRISSVKAQPYRGGLVTTRSLIG